MGLEILAVSKFSSSCFGRDFSSIIYLTTLQYSCDSIYMPSLVDFVDATAFYSMSHMRVIHAHNNSQLLGLSLVRQRRVILVSSYGVPANNKGTSRVDYLKAFPKSMRIRFASYLALM